MGTSGMPDHEHIRSRAFKFARVRMDEPVDKSGGAMEKRMPAKQSRWNNSKRRTPARRLCVPLRCFYVTTKIQWPVSTPIEAQAPTRHGHNDDSRGEVVKSMPSNSTIS